MKIIDVTPEGEDEEHKGLTFYDDNDLESKILAKIDKAKENAERKQEIINYAQQEAIFDSLKMLHSNRKHATERKEFSGKLKQELEKLVGDEIMFPPGIAAPLFASLEKIIMEDNKSERDFIYKMASLEANKNKPGEQLDEPGQVKEKESLEEGGLSKQEISDKKKELQIIEKLKNLLDKLDKTENGENI